MQQQANRRVTHRRPRRVRWGRLLGVAVIVIFCLAILGLGVGAVVVEADARAVKADFHAHRYAAMASTIGGLAETLGLMRIAATPFDWLRLVPGVSGPYGAVVGLLSAGQADLTALGQALPPVLQAVEEPPGTPGRAARINRAVSAAGLTFQADASAIRNANAVLQSVNPAALPAFVTRHGINLTTIQAASATFSRLLPAITGREPILARILGIPTPQRYLLVFQNSGELRATGGFFTAYGYVPFDEGRLGKIYAQNIQALLGTVTYRPSPPVIIGTYLPVTYWHLRDANSAMPGSGAAVPDVPEAAQNIQRFYDSINGAPPINGMIFLDTWVADSLIGDVGGVNVPTVRGKVVRVTAANANVTMENMAENSGLPSDERKLFIATLMKDVLHDVMHGSSSILLKAIGTISLALQHEQVTLYFQNPQAERFVLRQDWAGAIPAHVAGDFVEVIDENLLGHKDNYWMQESYSVDIRTVHGRNLETVSIHWVEPALSVPEPPYLVVPYHSWVTVFAPTGSQLVSETASATGGDGQGGGIDSSIWQAEDATINKLEFGAHMNLPARTSLSQPPASGTLVSTFWLPPGVNIHRILLQKQPGIRSEPVTVTVNHVTQHVVLVNARQWLTF